MIKILGIVIAVLLAAVGILYGLWQHSAKIAAQCDDKVASIKKSHEDELEAKEAALQAEKEATDVWRGKYRSLYRDVTHHDRRCPLPDIIPNDNPWLPYRKPNTYSNKELLEIYSLNMDEIDEILEKNPAMTIGDGVREYIRQQRAASSGVESEPTQTLETTGSVLQELSV